MPRMNQLSNYRTTTTGAMNGATVVTYVKTVIVKFDDDTVTLDSGGWRTVTTKRKMQQASNQFGLGYSIYQHNGDWYVDHARAYRVLFEDGMSFPRG